MEKTFLIGDFCFRLTCDDGIVLPENFLRFEAEKGIPEYSFQIDLTDRFPRPKGRLAAQRGDLAVFEENGMETRYIGSLGAQGYYACSMELDSTHTKVLLADAVKNMTGIDPVFLSMFSMERHIIRRDSLILHCAYMERDGKAILFSAPSGTGKTTQATLWEKYRGTRVINGDKALLMKHDGGWTANGWPVCGSSGVCHNERLDIRAIVMLSQGKENTIRRLSPFQAFSQIYSQITVNFWNRDAQQHAMDLLEELIAHVPVYHLSCTISEGAVRCLEDALLKEDRRE